MREWFAVRLHSQSGETAHACCRILTSTHTWQPRSIGTRNTPPGVHDIYFKDLLGCDCVKLGKFTVIPRALAMLTSSSHWSHQHSAKFGIMWVKEISISSHVILQERAATIVDWTREHVCVRVLSGKKRGKLVMGEGVWFESKIDLMQVQRNQSRSISDLTT